MKKINLMVAGALGAMGQTLIQCINESENFNLTCGFDRKTLKLSEFNIYSSTHHIDEKIDCVIDFSHYTAAKTIAEFCIKNKLPLVSATTGLSENDENFIKDASRYIAVVRSKNYSYGVNVLNKIISYAAKLLYEDFDIEIIEAHHNKKADAPSGTAQLLADTIKNSVNFEGELVYGRYGKECKRKKGDITVHSVRGGTIPGEHEVVFCGNDEIIKISHSALSKKIFAMGSLKAAAFIIGKSNGYYTMEDIININE